MTSITGETIAGREISDSVRGWAGTMQTSETEWAGPRRTGEEVNLWTAEATNGGSGDHVNP
jgi:hypothetical protein